MAVTSCTLRRARSCTFDRRNRGSYQVEYDVRCNSIMGPNLVANGALSASPHALPALGADYDYESILGTGEKDIYSYALDYSVNVDDDDSKHFVITVNFTPLEPGEKPEDRTTVDPENRGAKYHWDVETVMKIADRNRLNVPITNGAGRSFDRPVQIERDSPLLVARFNVSTLATALSLTQTYSQAVNSVAWTFLSPNPAARTVLCKSARSGELTTEGAYSFYPMEFVFSFKETGETWDEKILNEGYGHYVMADGQTYGYGFASSDYDASDDPIPLTGVVLIANPGSVSTPTSVPQPATDLVGLAGDQITLRYASSAWSVSDPLPALNGSQLIYKPAKEIDENGVVTTNPVSEPILLYANGCRLPEGMLGNYVTERIRREVDFNGLNTYLAAS